MFLLAVMSVLAVTALADDTTAWTSEDLGPVVGEYRTGYAYYDGSGYHTDESISLPGNVVLPVSDNYRSWASFSVSTLDDRTHIETASLIFTAVSSASTDVQVKMMSREMHTLDPEIAFNIIRQAETVETISILQSGFYSVNITGDALDVLRAVVEGDDDHLVIGFHVVGNGSATITARLYDLVSMYLNIEFDDEAPAVPSLDPMDAYSTGDRIPVSWPPVNDNPLNGNRGEVTYQVGVCLPDAPADNPFYTSPWLEDTFWNLTGVVDCVTSTFRVRARDGSGFESSWSDPVNTTLDNSPPSVPSMHPLPEYTDGIHGYNVVYWEPSVDAGIGNVTYHLQVSISPAFDDGWRDDYTTDQLGLRVTLSQYLWDYYYRVRAIDGLGHTSGWSPAVRSIQDNSTPTIPVMIEEPEFTPGTSNTFSWHPSVDRGIGVYYYRVEVSTSPDFVEGSLLTGRNIGSNDTSLKVDDLTDGTTYYCRARSSDAFGHASNWSVPVSSTQDTTGPSAPFLHDLQEYMPVGSVTLTWGPAVDQGVGVTLYQVWWDRPGLPGPPVFLIDVIGQSFTLTNLGEGNWTFGVRAVDGFGHPGPFLEVNTTIDATPPSAPVLDPLAGYSNGTSITLSWSPSTDDSGVAGYRLSYHPEDHPEMVLHIETGTTQATVFGLQDNVTYLYTIRATDVMGNHAEGQWIEVTADDAPPWRVQMYQYPPTCFNGTSFEFAWLETHDVGVGGVEYNIFWDHVHVGGSYDHSVFTMKESGWMTGRSYNVTGLEEREYHAWVIARDAFGHSSSSTSVQFTVDLTGPEVTITSPAEGMILAGTVLIRIMVEDLNLDSYYLQYRLNGDMEWKNIIDDTPFPGGEGALVHWETAGLPDGDYTLRVTAEDAASHADSDEVIVELRKDILYPTEDEAGVDEGTGAGVYLGALALAISLVALLLALSSRRKAPAKDMGEWEESRH